MKKNFVGVLQLLLAWSISQNHQEIRRWLWSKAFIKPLNLVYLNHDITSTYSKQQQHNLNFSSKSNKKQYLFCNFIWLLSNDFFWCFISNQLFSMWNLVVLFLWVIFSLVLIKLIIRFFYFTKNFINEAHK